VDIPKRLGENNNDNNGGGGDTKGPESDQGLRAANEGEGDGGRFAYFGVF
jgi:hypothetical protein